MRRRAWLAWVSIAVVAAVTSIVTVVVVRTPPPPAAAPPVRTENADFAKLSPTDRDYPRLVDWVTVCEPAKMSFDDPIMFPNQPGRSHGHTFSGNAAVTAFSTPEQLAGAVSNCSVKADRSSYWMPTLLVDGRPVAPYVTRAYYRAATTNGSAIATIPFGLAMIAGDPMATSPQSAGIAGFQCRIEKQGAVVKKQALPPVCPAGAILEMSVVFPNCWDGTHLDSADHRSHMSYARGYRCDERHPVQIPQLTLAERFSADDIAGHLTLTAMNSQYTLHADFMNAWDPATVQTLVSRCINAGVACADVSDRRFPPTT